MRDDTMGTSDFRCPEHDESLPVNRGGILYCSKCGKPGVAPQVQRAILADGIEMAAGEITNHEMNEYAVKLFYGLMLLAKRVRFDMEQ